MDNEQLADEILSEMRLERQRYLDHQMAGRSIEDYGGPTEQEVIISVLEKHRERS